MGVSVCPHVHTPPYIWTSPPPYILTPPYVQRVLIGYLFCYIIKCFRTLEAVMEVVRLRGCPYAPMCIHPIQWETPICSESFNRVFILLYHKMFSYFRDSHGGLSDLGGVHIPPMFICPLYI